MPIYDYTCDCGHRFEAYVPTMTSPAPGCPSCGSEPRRRPAPVALAGHATPPPGPEQAPRSWEETRGGDPEVVGHWRRTLERRRKLEEKYPELAGGRRAVLAHEGPYADRPLRAGDHAHPHSDPASHPSTTRGES
ncbi:MAG: FmdB family zinc ribbon protein [Streptosporangiaceae bacterium]